MATATEKLAVHGGTPIRDTMLPYSRQSITDDDRAAVLEALDSDWLTTGPRVGEFERAFAGVAGTSDAVTVSNGTAALHLIMAAAGIQPGDEVIVPALTFVASANCAAYVGAVPVAADVDPTTLLLDPSSAARRITDRTRAIVAVDYAGQPCDYLALRALAEQHGLFLVADACPAPGAADHGQPVGSLAAATAFSFHPVKPMTTGEGGMITTADAELAARARSLRSHGITSDWRERELRGSWTYDMVELG